MQTSFVPVLSVLLGAGLLISAGCQKGSSTVQPVAAKTEPVKAAQAPAPAGALQSVPVAAQKAPEPVQATARGPRIKVEAPDQDFGNIGPETVHTMKFAFRNVGTAPLKIVRVTGCCGSQLRGVEAGQEYKPGETGELVVDFSSGLQPGPLNRKLSIETNDPDEPISNMTIKANVVFPVDHQPQVLNLFTRQENAGCGPITLKSTDGTPFAITSFKSTANTITAEFDPSVKATQFTLKPKADVEKLKRSPSGQVSIELSHPEHKNIRIMYDVRPDFSISPPQLTLFNLKADQPLRRDIWVISNYQEDFDIESVSSQRGSIKLIESKKMPPTEADKETVKKGGKAGARYQLQIEIMPPVLEKERSILSDVLEVKIKGAETLTVQCRGFYASN